MHQQFCYTHPSGEDIYLFALGNGNGTEVMVTNYGAIITSFRVRNSSGVFNDIVLGFDRPQDYTDPDYLAGYPWFGAAIGRYANRIKDARFQLNGQDYPLSANSGTHQLHGGMEGFDKKVWQLVSYTGTSLELSLQSPDGDEGFPGDLQVHILFEVSVSGNVSYTYTATCNKACPVNLTHHGYFNLNNGQGTIDDHEVKIYAHELLAQNIDFVTTGNMTRVLGTPHDFTHWKKINAAWNPVEGYDQSFVINNGDDTLQLAAEVFSQQSNCKLQVWTTEPIVHLYTGRWIPSVMGKNNTRYGAFSGLCLETQVHPNAVNIPSFPNTILQPGQVYRSQTVYVVAMDAVK